MRFKMRPSMLLAFAPLAMSVQGPIRTPEARAEQVQGSDRAQDLAAAYRGLVAEYEAAAKAHKQALRDAPDRAARKELRRQKVETEFWPRFEALASKGSGRATLWLLQHATRSGLGPSDAKALRAELYRRLVADHAAADWFGDALADLGKANRDLGIEWLREALARVAEVNPSREIQARALADLAQSWMRKGGSEEQAVAILSRLAKDFADTKPGKAAADRVYELEHLVVGKVAPDFEASTIDGYEFKLSDFRGKTVLLDFYGFW